MVLIYEMAAFNSSVYILDVQFDVSLPGRNEQFLCNLS